MDIIYYRTKDGHVPAKSYLMDRYAYDEGDDVQKRLRKRKLFLKVDSVIKMTADNKGVAGGEFSSMLHGYDFQELRIPEGDDLVRILYFAHHREKLVLLNAYDKPHRYEKAGKKKIQKKIEDINRQTQRYYEDFLRNSDQYEKYGNHEQEQKEK